MISKNLLHTALGLSVFLLLIQSTTHAHYVFVSLSAPVQQTDEADSYKAFYDANKANDVSKAMELAQQYLKDFPNGKYAEYLKTKWIPNTLTKLFNEAYTAKNSDKMISLGNEILATNPDDLNYILPLAQHLVANELNAKPPITTHATEAEAFMRRAVKLLEEGKKPAEGSGWKTNEILTYFYQVLAGIEQKNKHIDNAIAFYGKAQALDPTNSFPYFQTGGIYQQRYIQAAEKYQALPEAERSAATPSTQAQALLKEVNDAADSMLDRWITFLKLTATKNTYGDKRAEIEGVVAEVYKYRHPDSPEKFRELIKP